MPVRVVNVKAYVGPVVYVGRPHYGFRGHPLANPFKLKLATGMTAAEQLAAREACVAEYREWLKAQPEYHLFHLWGHTLHGVVPLGCWCGDWRPGQEQLLLCHAVALAETLAAKYGPDKPTTFRQFTKEALS